MASPHISGAAALYLERDPNMTPIEVWKAMEFDAVQGALSLGGFHRLFGSPNLLRNTHTIVPLRQCPITPGLKLVQWQYCEQP
jgi:hypothetical protein